MHTDHGHGIRPRDANEVQSWDAAGARACVITARSQTQQYIHRFGETATINHATAASFWRSCRKINPIKLIKNKLKISHSLQKYCTVNYKKYFEDV